MREDDLIEEIGRVHGYEKIPERLPEGSIEQGGVYGVERKLDVVREAMVRCGFTQAMSHSLRDKHPLDFTEDWRAIIRNPHAPEMAYLRDSLLPCLSDAALRNGGRNLHLFEIGKVFVKGELQYDESPELAILSTGALYPQHWSSKERAEADFYSIKGVVERVAESLGVAMHFDHPRDPDRRFHPTRQAGVLVDEGKLWAGTVGQIHPDLAEELGLPIETVLAEIDLLVLFSEPEQPLKLRSISRNPAVRRDIAILISKSVPYSQIEEAVAEASGEVLEKQWLFDVYEGKGIQEGSHSLAIAMQLRKLGENLTDEEANQVRDSAVEALERLGGKQRA